MRKTGFTQKNHHVKADEHSIMVTYMGGDYPIFSILFKDLEYLKRVNILTHEALEFLKEENNGQER